MAVPPKLYLCGRIVSAAQLGADCYADCLQALSSYASLLDRSSPIVGPPPTATPTETPDDRVLAAAAGQAAASRSQAAASMLLLLAYMGTTRSLGALTVSCSQSQHIQQSVVPAVSQQMLQCLASVSHAYCISCALP